MTAIKGHNANVTCVNWSLDDPYMFCSGDEKGIFRIWDSRTQKTVKAFMAPNKGVINSAAFYDKKCFVASGNELNEIDIRTDGLFVKNVLFTSQAKDEINKIRIDIPNNRYGYCDDDGSVTVFQLDNNEKIVELSEIHKSVCCYFFLIYKSFQ